MKKEKSNKSLALSGGIGGAVAIFVSILCQLYHGELSYCLRGCITKNRTECLVKNLQLLYLRKLEQKIQILLIKET